MLVLYLRFLIPLALLYYGIKKNPFYKSYPIMLPFMVILFCICKPVCASTSASLLPNDPLQQTH